jgi:hypothetical protein
MNSVALKQHADPFADGRFRPVRVASGDVLGVRLTTRDPGAVGSGLSSRTYWYDGKAGAYRTALGLVADSSREAFVAAPKDELKGREGVDATTLHSAFSDPQERTAVLDDMASTADGGLRVNFDRGDVGVPAAGSYRVALPKETITPWLSAFGLRAQRQTMKPSGPLDLGAIHTPHHARPRPHRLRRRRHRLEERSSASP